ncbi:transcriptional regulator GutM [Brachybacterium phenoliresistens]|uniref:Glucitol operon activator protein n=1 Tax=Brachybacterium phenoliresistens TaxID=396014 RepID=Z9JPT0_9MICO|nr:transcriptional regulator GutM [Brachybacterium phenoliresistens]EWS80405.1 glucitol operon activator protein [Brachybacterium phenoliresistens]
MDQLGFVVLLIAAILLSFAFSYLQHRAYSRTVRAVALAHDRTGVVVVSGRGKGFLRGCVVILAVDTTTRRILEARTMQGSTVLARFRRAEFLEGPLKAAPSRATSRWMEEALQQATTQYRETARSARRSHPAATTPKGSAA